MKADFALHIQQVEEAVSYLKERLPFQPEVILVLGTGLGSFVDDVEISLKLPYSDIPHFPQSTVESHEGNLYLGIKEGVNIVILHGRCHFYEGYSIREVTFPVRVLSLLGPSILLITNASGGLNLDFSAGSLMIMEDHLNFIPENPLRGPNNDFWGPRFPDLSKPYDSSLVEISLRAANELAIENVVTGTYVAIPGPSLETPAETRFLRRSGADAVGMSTVPEVVVAIHAGLRVLGISVIANVNDPDNFEQILIEDVIEQVNFAANDLQKLVSLVLHKLSNEELAQDN